jgi:hypothetical protein
VAALEGGVNGVGAPDAWLALLESQAASMLSGGQQEVMAVLGRQFESALIRTALKHTHGRKNDAAVAGHRPQHHHPQDRRTRHRRRQGRLSANLNPKRSGSDPVWGQPCAPQYGVSDSA